MGSRPCQPQSHGRCSSQPPAQLASTTAVAAACRSPVQQLLRWLLQQSRLSLRSPASLLLCLAAALGAQPVSLMGLYRPLTLRPAPPTVSASLAECAPCMYLVLWCMSMCSLSISFLHFCQARLGANTLEIPCHARMKIHRCSPLHADTLCFASSTCTAASQSMHAGDHISVFEMHVMILSPCGALVLIVKQVTGFILVAVHGF